MSPDTSASITAETLIDFLVTAPLFRALSSDELAEVAGVLEVLEIPEGYKLFDEGEEGDAWYVVYSGELVVTKNMPGGPTHDLARLERGDCFGEMALLDDSPRTAAVTADAPAIVLRFHRDGFNQLLETERLSAFKLVHAMSKVLCQRQREVTQILADIVDDPVGRPEATPESVVSLLWSPAVWE